MAARASTSPVSSGRWTVDNTALGFVAGPTGRWLEDGLRDQGVKTDFIHLNQGVTRINVKIKASEETEINGMGPQIGEADMEQLYAKLDQLGSGDALVLAGSIPSCLSGDTYEKIMARLEGRGVRIVVDATRDLLVNVLKYKPFLIKPNKPRAGGDFWPGTDHRRRDHGMRRPAPEPGRPECPGEHGRETAPCCWTKPARPIGWVCPRARFLNSVGAGDSMVAGFLAGYLQKGDYNWALRLGTAAGSATAFSLGLATREKIEDLLTTF